MEREWSKNYNPQVLSRIEQKRAAIMLDAAP